MRQSGAHQRLAMPAAALIVERDGRHWLADEGETHGARKSDGGLRYAGAPRAAAPSCFTLSPSHAEPYSCLAKGIRRAPVRRVARPCHHRHGAVGEIDRRPAPYRRRPSLQRQARGGSSRGRALLGRTGTPRRGWTDRRRLLYQRSDARGRIRLLLDPPADHAEPRSSNRQA